jgi:hypothetical protein
MKKMKLLVLEIATMFTFSAYAINPSAMEGGPPYQIGDYAQGGVIFWLTPDGQHGIVADIIDLNDGNTIRWDTAALPSALVGSKGTGLSLGANYESPGLINTNLIVALYGTATPYAALLCTERSVTIDGVTYNDWYLPSFEELDMMVMWKGTINSVAIAHGGSAFAADFYWSSYESSNSSANSINFANGDLGSGTKVVPQRVRAARTF